MNKEELNCYHKIFAIIRKTDLLNYDEKDELHLFLMKFKDENNQLKERITYLERSCERKEETIRNERDENIELSNKIDKAIEYLINPPKKIWEGHSIDEVVRILKGDVDE